VTVNELLILIPAVTAAVVSVINAITARSREQKLDTNTELTAQTHDTTTQIKTLVNGQSEALRAALLAAQERCRALEAELAQLKGQP
jgi:sensor domain CHASE-containing protein